MYDIEAFHGIYLFNFSKENLRVISLKDFKEIFFLIFLPLDVAVINSGK